ncbi:MAG: acetyl-CoA carboxylase biotin carboxyl carrier protein [Bacteroidetes bacterium]|nr:acetyl-CoA carboxylase biotin carboxyl carrier protein [Bacteroidota bacterium]MDA0943071.1 acetyl-CoA carboxylase biotin carboxyl carrier protein [Bacteroidota bacterium]MDA1112292.1 acetyl-CoA carboxylase biotin carboxyl carrier protein [Bacteroidota bacterium]
MDLKEIQQLIKFVSVNGVDEVAIERKDFKLHIKKNAVQVVSAAPVAAAAPAPVAAAPAPAAAAPAAITASDDSKYIAIKSLMVGTFYRSSNPESPSFINVGDDVKPGKVVCIVEAMKLFNEIESEISGKIVKVLVDNASPVEYDQPLFLVDPS